MRDLIYVTIFQMLMVGVGLGWFVAGFAQPFRIRFGLGVMALFCAVAWSVRFLLVVPS